MTYSIETRVRVSACLHGVCSEKLFFRTTRSITLAVVHVLKKDRDGGEEGDSGAWYQARATSRAAIARAHYLCVLTVVCRVLRVLQPPPASMFESVADMFGIKR